MSNDPLSQHDLRSNKIQNEELDAERDLFVDQMADLIIDSFLAMTPEQRKKFKQECERDKLSQVKK